MTKLLNDFSALKSLRKELESKESEQAPAKAEPQKRGRTVIHPSKEESHARSIGIVKGTRVRMMDSPESGKIVGFGKEFYEIETDDGYIIKSRLSDFVVVNAEEDRALYRSMPSAGKKKEQKKSVISPAKDLAVDLHFERIPGYDRIAEWAAMEFQLDYFKRVLRENLKYKGKRIVFIHGDGDGVLRDAIRKELNETFALSCSWAPARSDEFGTGATAVTIR